MLGASYPQEVTGRIRFEKIVNNIFNHGLDDKRHLTALKQAILNDKDAKAMMICVLQKEDEEDN